MSWLDDFKANSAASASAADTAAQEMYDAIQEAILAAAAAQTQVNLAAAAVAVIENAAAVITIGAGGDAELLVPSGKALRVLDGVTTFGNWTVATGLFVFTAFTVKPAGASIIEVNAAGELGFFGATPITQREAAGAQLSNDSLSNSPVTLADAGSVETALQHASGLLAALISNVITINTSLRVLGLQKAPSSPIPV